MRKLSITRKKAFVASLLKMKVYIEDSEGELTICGVRVKKLGKLKNGETAVFDIPEDKRKIFVIADEMSRNYCFDCYQLEAGSYDVTLTGQNRFDTYSSNAFKFDNNPTTPITIEKKPLKIKTALFIILCAALGVVIGCFAVNGIFNSAVSADKDFTFGKMTVTLTNEFTVSEQSSDSMAIESKEMAILLTEAEVENPELTSKEQLLIDITEAGLSEEIKEKDGLVYFTYNAEDEGVTVTYFAYKYETGFYNAVFLTAIDDSQKLESEIFDYAKSVKFK